MPSKRAEDHVATSHPVSRRASSAHLGRRPELDGLRGIAVLLVVGLHVGIVAGGWIGVDVFFALSGFLITALLCEEWERGGRIGIRRFYLRRVRRLLPALLILVVGFTLLMLVAHPFNGLWPLGRFIATTLLAVNNWVTALVPRHGQVLGALVPTWTLAEEIQFYALWPLALWLLLRRQAGSRRVLGTLLLAMLGLLGAAALMRHIDPFYNAYTSPFDRGAELLLGGAAAIVWRERIVPAKLRSPLVGWAAAGGLAFVVVDAAAPQRWVYLLSAVLAAVLIVNLLSSDPRSGRSRVSVAGRSAGDVLHRLLGSRPLRYTGKISYGVYLYHLPIYYTLWTYVPGRSRYFYAPIVLAASISAATASWRLIETPILRRAWREVRLQPTRVQQLLRRVPGALARARAVRLPPAPASDCISRPRRVPVARGVGCGVDMGHADSMTGRCRYGTGREAASPRCPELFRIGCETLAGGGGNASPGTPRE
jgi:peptidoglycan/LPS O-acetylase OafA/YrhL